MKPQRLTAVVAAATLLLAPISGLAEDATSLAARIQKLEAELALVKRQQEVAEEKQVAVAEKAALVEYGAKGLAITSPDKKYALSLRGNFQFDSRNFLNDDAETGKDDLLARRLRPIIEAKAGNASFRLMPDFAGSTTRVFDAHADYKLFEELQFRVGKFKTPVSLERLQSPADMFFIERGHPSNLAPSRDTGAMIYGNLLPDQLEYQIGVFDGNADLANTDSDDDDGKDIAARLFAHPFRNADTVALQGIGIGIAGSVGERDGSTTTRILGTYRTPGQQDFFRYRNTSFADGQHWRIYPQGYWYYGPYGLLAEVAISNQEVSNGANHDTLQNEAWQVAASYVLTGEDVNFRGGIKPYENFDVASGGIGAWEITGRVGQTDVDNSAFGIYADSTVAASLAQSFGGGLNWYLSENLKLMVNYDYTQFEGGAAGTADRPDEHALFTRTQFRF